MVGSMRPYLFDGSLQIDAIHSLSLIFTCATPARRLLFFLREPHAGGGSFALLLCGATAWRGGAWRPCGRCGQAPGHLRLRSAGPGVGSVGAVAASSTAAGAQSQPRRCTSAEDHGVNDAATVRPCLGSGWICLRSSRVWCRPPFKGETGRRQPSAVVRRGAEVAWRGCPADGSSLPAPSLSSCAAGRHGAGRKQLGHCRAIMAER